MNESHPIVCLGYTQKILDGDSSFNHLNDLIGISYPYLQAVSFFTQNNFNTLTDLQRAACQLIPAGYNLALAIKDLVICGNFYAATTLMRLLFEKSIIFCYLHHNKNAIKIWESGWAVKDRPSLNYMVQFVFKASKNKSSNDNSLQQEAIYSSIKAFHSLTHGDPMGLLFNLLFKNKSTIGYIVGYNTIDIERMTFPCQHGMTCLLVLISELFAVFPDNLIHYTSGYRPFIDFVNEINANENIKQVYS